LSHGLRRRALGLFRSSSTTALMHKVAKSYPPAAVISKLITEVDSGEGVKYVKIFVLIRFLIDDRLHSLRFNQYLFADVASSTLYPIREAKLH